MVSSGIGCRMSRLLYPLLLAALDNGRSDSFAHLFQPLFQDVSGPWNSRASQGVLGDSYSKMTVLEQNPLRDLLRKEL